MQSQEDRDEFDLDAFLASIHSQEGVNGRYLEDAYDVAAFLASTVIPGGKFQLRDIRHSGPPWDVCQFEIEQETEAWRKGSRRIEIAIHWCGHPRLGISVHKQGDAWGPARDLTFRVDELPVDLANVIAAITDVIGADVKTVPAAEAVAAPAAQAVAVAAPAAQAVAVAAPAAQAVLAVAVAASAGGASAGESGGVDDSSSSSDSSDDEEADDGNETVTTNR